MKQLALLIVLSSSVAFAGKPPFNPNPLHPETKRKEERAKYIDAQREKKFRKERLKNKSYENNDQKRRKINS